MAVSARKSMLYSLSDKKKAYSNMYFDRRTVAEIPNLLYLLMTAMVIKMSLTVITFGCTVPGGIFLPSLIIGAITGRVIGLIMQYLTLTYPNAWPFTACAQDFATRGECVIPGVYAIVGAAAGLAGVTRTTSKRRSRGVRKSSANDLL